MKLTDEQVRNYKVACGHMTMGGLVAALAADWLEMYTELAALRERVQRAAVVANQQDGWTLDILREVRDILSAPAPSEEE